MSKKQIMLFISISALVNICVFLIYFFKVLFFFRHPTDFSVSTLFITVGAMIGLLFHAGLYVRFMDYKKRQIREIQEESEWWRKWDYDYKGG